MDGLEEFLRVLSDGKTWQLGRLAEKLGWTEQQVKRYCELVSVPELVFYDENNHSVRIDPALKKLILELDKQRPEFEKQFP